MSGIRSRIALTAVVAILAIQPTRGGSLASVSPGSASAGIMLTIVGTGFNAIAANNNVTFTPTIGSPVTVPALSVISIDTTRKRLTVKVPAGLPVGTTALLVTNRVTGEASAGRSIEVIAFALDPAAAGPGTTATITVQGSANTQLTATSTRVAISGSGVTITATSVPTPTTAIVSVSVTADAAAGPRDVSVVSGSLMALVPGGFTIGTAAPANQAPVVSAGPPQTVTLPAAAALAGSATDDGLPTTGTLTTQWTEVSGPGTATFANAASPTTTAAFSQAGTYVLRLTANDSALSSTSDVTITVNPPANHPPAITSSPVTTARNALPYSYQVTATDADGDALTYSLTAAPGGMTIGASNGLVAWTPSGQVGDQPVNVVVTDPSGAVATQSFTVHVVDVTPPFIRLSGPSKVLPGAQIAIAAQANDDVGVQGVTFTVDGGAASDVTSPPYRQLLTVPSDAAAGTVFHIRGTARDTSQNTSSDEIAVAVTSAPDTQPPSITLHAPAQASPGATINLSAAAADNVGVKAVNFSTGSSSIASDDSAPYETTFAIPTDAVVGSTLTFVAQADDFSDNSSRDIRTVSVVAAADTTPAAVSVTVPPGVVQGAPVTVSATITNNVPVSRVDFIVNGVVVATATEPPFQATFDVPPDTPTDAPLQVEARAINFFGAETAGTAQAPVASGSTNHDPVANAGGPYSGPANAAIAFDARASSDPDSDPLAYSWDFGDGTKGSGPAPTHVYVGGGTFVVLVTVDDGRGGTDTASSLATVQAAADSIPPVIQLPGPTQALPGTQVTLTAAASDNVGVTGVHFEVNGADGTDATSAPFQRTIDIPAVAAPGDTIRVRATASDAAGNTAFADATLTIASQPDTEKPSVALHAPSQTAAGGSLVLSADAADNVGVASVTFLVNGASVGSAAVPPFQVNYTVPASAPAGSRLDVVVQAFDFTGNEADAAGSVDVVSIAPTTPPSVSLTAPSTATAGSAIVLSALASDNVGVASVSFFVGGASIATITKPPYQTQFVVPPSAAGSVLRVEAHALNFSGLQAIDTAETQVATVSALGQGTVTGVAFDDTTGLPLAGAGVSLVGADSRGAPYAQTTTTDAEGRFVLTANEGQAIVRIAQAGWTSVDRPLTIVADGATAIVDARLTPLAQSQRFSAVIGGSSSAAGATLGLPPGALPADAALTLTVIAQQGIEGPLPPGWTPVGVVDIAPHGVAFAGGAAVSAPNVFKLPLQTALVVAVWDEQAAVWRVVGSSSVGGDGSSLQATVPASGQVAWLLADTQPSAPPAPNAGDPLTGATSASVPDDATAVVDPQPKVLFFKPGVHSDVHGRITTTAPLPSGTLVLSKITEAYSFRSGDQIHLDPMVEELVFYQTPGTPSVLTATYPVTPSLAFDPLTLDQGVITAELHTAPSGIAQVQTVGPSGGSVSAGSGESAQFAAGAFGAVSPVAMQAMTLADTGLTLPPALEFLDAVLVSFPGSLTQPMTLAIPRPPQVTDTSLVLVLEAREIGGQTRLVLVAVGRVLPGQIVTDTALGGTAGAFEGPTSEGRYLFVRANTDLGFATGEVAGTTGDPFAGALVSSSNLPVVALSRQTGAYVDVLGTGPATLTAVDVLKSDSGTAAITVASAGGIVQQNLQLSASIPAVTSIAPGDGATNFALTSPIVVTFSKPIDPATVSGASAGNVALADAAGAPVAGTIGLSSNNTVLTFRPSDLLAPGTGYVFTAGVGIADPSGRHLTSAAVVHFTSLTTTAPAPPPAGSITASIPDSTGQTTITASQGTADPHNTVAIFNATTGATTPVSVDGNGGFSVAVAASPTDKLQVVITGASGRQTKQDLPRFTRSNPDGSLSIAVGADGGHLDGPGGVGVDVPAGAFPGGAIVTLKPVSAQEFPVQLTPEQQQAFSYSGGLSLDLGGQTPLAYLNVSIPTTGGETAQDRWVVAQVANLNGQTFLASVDTAHVIDGRIRTSSPPCPGVTGTGVYGFLKSARPLGVTYFGIPNPSADLSAQLLVGALVPMLLPAPGVYPGSKYVPISVPYVATAAETIAAATLAEFRNQSRQVCLPMLSGRVTLVPNSFTLTVAPGELNDGDTEVVVSNVTRGTKDFFHPPFTGNFTIEGGNNDEYRVEALDWQDDVREIAATRVPRSYERVDVDQASLLPTDQSIEIRNETRNTVWSSAFSTARPMGSLSAIVDGTDSDAYTATVTDGSGAARTVAFTKSPYPFGSGNLLLRAEPGTIDPTHAEIDAYNSHVPDAQKIDPATNPGVTQVVLLVSGASGSHSETILDAAGDTSRVATGAFDYAVEGTAGDRYSLLVSYENGTTDTIDIPTFHVTVTDGPGGSVVKELDGFVPPQGEPLKIDLGLGGAPPQLSTSADGYLHVDARSPLILSFSQALDPQSVASYMKLFAKDSQGNPVQVPGSWELSDQNRTAVFVPSGSIQMGKTYEVELSGVTASGQPLSLNTIPIKTYEPRRLGNIALPDPHTTVNSIANVNLAAATAVVPFNDVEIAHGKTATGQEQTTVIASTSNAQGFKYHDVDVTNPRTPVEIGHTAGGMPKRLRLLPGAKKQAIDISYDVPLVPQQTSMSCWAAGAAMIVAFRDHVSVDPIDIAMANSTSQGCSSCTGYWQQYVQGLNSAIYSDFLSTWGLVAEAPQTYTVDGFRQLLQQYGPLWVGTAQGGAHIRVVTGMSGDGTPDGTYVTVNDPWEPGMYPFRLPNAGGTYDERYTDFVAKQEYLAGFFYGNEDVLADMCGKGNQGACNILTDPALHQKLTQCVAGDQSICDQLGLPFDRAVFVAHLPALPPGVGPETSPDQSIPLTGGATDVLGTVPSPADRITLLNGCSQNVSIGTNGDPVFTGSLLTAPLYSSLGSGVNFFDVTDPTNPCLLGGRALTRNPETVPPPGGADHSAHGTVQQYGYASGAAVVHTTTGAAAYVAVGQLGLMPVDVGKNIPELGPDARLVGDINVYPGDYVDVIALGDHLLALNNNFGGLPTLDAFDGNLSPVGSVPFDDTRAGFAKVHQVIAARGVSVPRLQPNGQYLSKATDLAFVAGANGVTVFDVSDLTHMAVIGNVPMPGIVRQLALSKDGKTLFAGGDGGQTGGTMLYIVDVSSPYITGLVDADHDGQDDRILYALPYVAGVQGEIQGFDYDDARGLAYVSSDRELDIWAIRRGAAVQFNNPPVAKAGPDASVDQNAQVTLDGSGSSDPDDDPLTFSWTQTGGPSVVLAAADTAHPTFAAPAIDDAALTFSLIVSDGLVNSAPSLVTITIRKKASLTLTPRIAAIAVVPGTKQLGVTLVGTDGTTSDATADPKTSYRWIGNGLVSGVDGVPDVTAILNAIAAKLGVPFQLADIDVSPAGVLTVNTPGLQVLRAHYDSPGIPDSNYSVVLAGISLGGITLRPDSALTTLVGELTEALGSSGNPPMVLVTDDNGFILDKGVILLDDVVFDLAGGTISLKDLMTSLQPLVQDALTGVLEGGTGPAAPALAAAFTKMIGLGLSYAGTQFLNPLDSADTAIATVTQQPPFQGIVQSQQPGLTTVSGTLDLGELGKADDAVLVWVLPQIASATIEPNLTVIRQSDPALPGPSVRTFVQVKAVESAQVPLSGKAKTAAELLDRVLPGGLASWSTSIDKDFVVNAPAPNLRFHFKGSVTPSCGDPDAAGEVQCTLSFSQVSLGFYAPNHFPLFQNTYHVADETLATVGLVEAFDTHLVRQNKLGLSQLTGYVSMPLLGDAKDSTAHVAVVGTGPILTKKLAPDATGQVPTIVEPATNVAFTITVTNPFDSALTDVQLTDAQYFQKQGSSEKLFQTQTIPVGSLQPHQTVTLSTTAVAPNDNGVLRNEVSADGSAPASASIAVSPDTLHLTPRLILMPAAPADQQLQVTLEHTDGRPAEDVTTDVETVYEWLGNGLLAGVGGVPAVQAIFDAINDKLAAMGESPIPVQLAQVSVQSGVLHVNSPGIQVVRARRGDLPSEYALVLAGLKLTKIVLKPQSIPTAIVSSMASFENQPLILLPNAPDNSVLSTTGQIVLDDATFQVLGGPATLSARDIVDVINGAAADAVAAFVGGGTSPMAPLVGWVLNHAEGVAGAQFLDPIASADAAVASVTDKSSAAPLRGTVTAHASGFTSISGTLDLGSFGKASDDVPAFVLPPLGPASVQVDPEVTFIDLGSQPPPAPRPGPAVRLFATLSFPPVTIPLTGRFADKLQAIDRFLPGGLARWGSGTASIDAVVDSPVPGFKFHLGGAASVSCVQPGADDSGCSVSVSGATLGLHLPNIPPSIKVGYALDDPTLATPEADANQFDTHIVHNGVVGASPMTGTADMIAVGLGKASDPNALVVTAPLVKRLVSSDASHVTYELIVTNARSETLVNLSLRDDLFLA
ncbi:MAG: Ig-like domain-containing protein, partial [Betaproteobacteria bacterium]